MLALNRDDPGLFQESANAVAHALGDFLVVCDGKGKLIGCAGLHRDSPELAEIYAVAVTPEWQGHGIGGMLMQACQQCARMNGVPQLWLATIKPSYFARYGFQPISRWQLPASVLLRNSDSSAASQALVACFARTTRIHALPASRDNEGEKHFQGTPFE